MFGATGLTLRENGGMLQTPQLIGGVFATLVGEVVHGLCGQWVIDETEIAKWLRGRGVALIPVMTKADQLKKHERKPAAEKLRAALGARPLVVSSTTGDGLEELWRALAVALGGRNL